MLLACLTVQSFPLHVLNKSRKSVKCSDTIVTHVLSNHVFWPPDMWISSLMIVQYINTRIQLV